MRINDYNFMHVVEKPETDITYFVTVQVAMYGHMRVCLTTHEVKKLDALGYKLIPLMDKTPTIEQECMVCQYPRYMVC